MLLRVVVVGGMLALVGGCATQRVADSNTHPVPAAGGAAHASSGVRRPAYNTGDGFFVLNGTLYDANGIEFRIRGLNSSKRDDGEAQAMANTNTNTVRFYKKDFNLAPADEVNLLTALFLNYGEVPIVSLGRIPNTSKDTTGDVDPANLQAVVDYWIANASYYTTLNKWLILNPANEWGPATKYGDGWASAYAAQIPRLRAAGYLGPLMIDAGGWGQDEATIENYAQQVWNSDPQKNLIFSIHIYRVFSNNTLDASTKRMQAACQQMGAVLVVGEFGPGNNAYGSGYVDPQLVVSSAEANGVGWMPWAWDEANGPYPGGPAGTDGWLSLSRYTNLYNTSADLTLFGQKIVEGCLNPDAVAGCGGGGSPQYSGQGLKNLAQKASIFP